MSDEPFRTLRLHVSEGVARVTIDHPPLNLLDASLLFGSGRRCALLGLLLHAAGV